MQNLEVGNEKMKKNQKTKKEMNEELEELIINKEKCEYKEINEKVRMVENSRDTAEVIREFEDIITCKKKSLDGTPNFSKI